VNTNQYLKLLQALYQENLGVMFVLKTDGQKSHSAEANFKIEYLPKYELIFETALANESVDPGGIVCPKTEGRKFRKTVPLIYLFTQANLELIMLAN
jgi:hypothetical protein